MAMLTVKNLSISFGGLKAVAVSDTINGIGLLIAGVLIPFIALAVLAKETGGSGIIDGWKYMVEADPAKMNAWSERISLITVPSLYLAEPIRAASGLTLT